MSRVSVLSFVAALLLFPAFAFGHAEEPNAQSVHPLSDGEWIVRANFGVVSSTEPERFVCEEAFHGGEGWLLGVLGPSEWITFGEQDVRRTEDGCSFELIAEVAVRPSDAAVHSGSGAVAYIVNSPDGAVLFVSTDRGQSFRPTADLAPEDLHLTGVRFLDADSLIVSAYTKDEARGGRLFRVSVEGSIEELALPPDLSFPYVLDAGGGQIALLARRESQVVFWGAPDAMTEADSLEAASWPTGARLSSDGTRLWIAGLELGRGITLGVREGGVVTWSEILTEDAVSCIGGDERALYLCGLGRLDGADVFRVDGASKAATLDFRALRGPVSCPATSDVGAICPLVWKEIASYFGVDPNADAGATPGRDAGVADGGDVVDVGSADAAVPSGGSAGDCCSTTGGRDGSTFVMMVGVLLMGVLRRLHRRR